MDHTLPLTHLEDALQRRGWSWGQLAVVLAGTLVLGLFAAVRLDGLALTSASNTLRIGLIAPCTVCLHLGVQSALIRHIHHALVELLQHIRGDPGAAHATIRAAVERNRAQEGWAVALGAVFGWLVFPAWGEFAPWLTAYWVVSLGIGFGVTGWFLYTAFATSRIFSALSAHEFDLPLMEPSGLEPVATWSLWISLTLLADLCLAAALQPAVYLDTTEVAVTYVTLTAAAAAGFFVNLYASHRILLRTKERALHRVRAMLRPTTADLLSPGDEPDTRVRVAVETSALLDLEHRLMDVAEWPYTSAKLTQLLLAVVAPVAIWIVRGVGVLRFLATVG